MNRMWVVMVLLITLAVLLVSGCSGQSNPPASVPGGSDQAGGSAGYVDSRWNKDTSKSVTESNSAVKSIAGYLEAGDADGFNSSLSQSNHELAGSRNFNRDEAAKIGAAMKTATVTTAAEDMVFYEMTVDGQTCSFSMIKEDGGWKLDGF